MHEDAGYTFTGPNAITALTPQEELTLQLGFLIKQEQVEEERKKAEAGGAGNQRRSTPKYRSEQEALAAYTKKHDLDNRAYQ